MSLLTLIITVVNAHTDCVLEFLILFHNQHAYQIRHHFHCCSHPPRLREPHVIQLRKREL
ncbi:hypothetical protein CVT25_004207, partial [Psilocybe cyanescens]